MSVGIGTVVRQSCIYALLCHMPQRGNILALLSLVCYYSHTCLLSTIGSIPAVAIYVDPMKKLGLLLLLAFVLGLVVFSTWQLYAGNLPASFSTLPFLLITYLFVIKLRRPTE